jgi:Flp pilus assembly protein TadD
MSRSRKVSTRRPRVTPPPPRRAVRVVSPTLAEAYLKQGRLLLDARRPDEALPLLREAYRLRPEDPDVLNQMGRALWEIGQPQQAEPIFAKAISLNPNDPWIWNNLGLSYWMIGFPEQAIACYLRALDIQPNRHDTTMNLGAVLSDMYKLDEAMACLEEARRWIPESPDVLQNLATTLARQGRYEEAIEMYGQALRLRPDYAEVRQNRSTVWLNMGDFERGWPEYESRLKCRWHTAVKVSRPIWNGEDLSGRFLMLDYEAGLGDTLQFIRFAPLLKERGATVIVLAQPSVMRLIAPSRGVDVVFDGSSALPDCDFHISLMSLPSRLGTTLANLPARVPYLFLDPVLVDSWRSKLATAIGVDETDWLRHPPGTAMGAGARARPFLVGVVWQGNPFHRCDQFRSFPLAKLAAVAEVPGVRLVSLQAEDGLDQLRLLGGRFPIVELTSRRQRDFLDTACLVSLVDLVITPDTAVAHLSGALGVRIWVAVSQILEWRWMAPRNDSPWYPTARLFRQKTMGDWDGVFGRMADALRAELAGRMGIPSPAA